MPRAGRPCASESEGQELSEDCPKRPELVCRLILHRSVTGPLNATLPCHPSALVVSCGTVYSTILACLTTSLVSTGPIQEGILASWYNVFHLFTYPGKPQPPTADCLMTQWGSRGRRQRCPTQMWVSSAIQLIQSYHARCTITP